MNLERPLVAYLLYIPGISLFFSLYGVLGMQFYEQLPRLLQAVTPLVFTFFQIPMVLFSTSLIAGGVVYHRLDKYEQLSTGREIGIAFVVYVLTNAVLALSGLSLALT